MQTIEREIKLHFETAAAARAAIAGIGATPLGERRLQDDCLLDTSDMALQRQGTTLRVRREAGTSRLTFKGPGRSATMKVREELETTIGDGALTLALFERLGFRPWFRAQKYREEFVKDDCVIAVDETPVGTYVEIEGSEHGITAVAAALGRSPADYLVTSYRSLYLDHCRRHGLTAADMTFPDA